MNKIEQFYETIKKEMTIAVATSADGRVTMRTVSPVFFQGSILFFTSADSIKFRQLQRNPLCCIAAGSFFAEATAKICGSTMRMENKELRDAYCEKFPQAFDENVEFGGREAQFILLQPSRLSGWAFEDDVPLAGGIPTVPFDISITEANGDKIAVGINIAPCGLVCSRCDACRATQENSPEKLELVAASWRELNSCDLITADLLPCDGCMNATGRKSYYCANMCEIRRCAIEKEIKVCSECPEFPCDKVDSFLKSAPEGQAKAMRSLLEAIADVERNMRSVF